MSTPSHIQRRLLKQLSEKPSQLLKNEDGVNDGDKMPSTKYMGDGPVFAPTAAAGSGEFHLYKVRKRREQEAESLEIAKEQAELKAKQFKARRAESELADQMRTDQNRRKRLKRAARRKKAADDSKKVTPKTVEKTSATPE